MVLKPLNNDEVEVDGSNHRDFFRPFYQGLNVYLPMLLWSLCLFTIHLLIVVDLKCSLFVDFRQRFTRLLSSTFRGMDYKLAMRLVLKVKWLP